MERIIREKIHAEQLLYVSLKYTKTVDVILNLIERWKSMIELSVDKLLETARKDKKVKSVPDAPRLKIELIKEIYKKNPDILKTMETYEFFKKVPDLEKIRENEFRKNFAMKVTYRGELITVNLEKLKEYADILERFISYLRQFYPMKQ